jgi:hypothetical protein
VLRSFGLRSYSANTGALPPLVGCGGGGAVSKIGDEAGAAQGKDSDGAPTC